MPRRMLRRAALVAALAVLLAVSGCGGRLFPSGVIEPTITPASGVTGSRTIDTEYAFEDYQVRLNVAIDSAVYTGAVNAPKSAVLIGDVPASVWVPGYYRAFVSERHQEAFYVALLQALHDLRGRQGLDDSRYIELVTSMAQALTYRTDPVNLAPKFPIETFGDGYGDCDDKALLAAGLLSRDGYDVAILLFEPEKHVALGVRAPGLDYQGSGYAYVEMTSPSLVGIPPDELSGGVRLSSKPDVIRIGEGTKAYGAADQIAFIQQRLEQLRASEKRLQAEITAGKATLDSQRTSLDAEKRAAEAMTDPAAASAAIRAYNAQVAAFNAEVERVNSLVRQANELVSAEKYVVEHQYARPQVYERLRALKL